MAVIVKDMEMPNKCADCRLTYLDTGDDAYFGANEYRCVIDDSIIDCNASDRAYDCPLKSVEGLIEKIEEKGFESPLMNPVFTMTEIIEIIAEYCGLEESDADRD